MVGPLVGFTGDGFFQGLPYPDRPHFSAFDWATCDAVFRDGETYVSKPPPEDTPGLTNASILYMDGAEHRRYRALVQPSFLPKRASWWTERWVGRRDPRADRPHGAERRGRPQRRVLLRHPVAHHHRQLRHLGRRRARHPRGGHVRRARDRGVHAHRPADRRRRGGEEPRDDLISVLVAAEVTDEDGGTHRSPTKRCWCSRSSCSRRDRAPRGSRWASRCSRCSGTLSGWTRCATTARSSARWSRSRCAGCRPIRCSVASSRDDTELAGVEVPEGAVMHMCLAAANRDPARWERPDEFDPVAAGAAPHRLRQRRPHLPGHARRPRGDRHRDRGAARPPA